ncbi:MAG: redoxin domain-containing protein, partial [Myxococcales bacterium]|nr:redoxin domain-containing protein [Myxococcales bacterium]
MGRLGPLKWIALIAIVALLTYEYLGKRSGPAVGEAAPDFTVPTWGQGEFTLSEHKGKIIVLDFWAT